MPRWAIAALMLLAAANVLYALYDARGNKFFLIRGARVSARTGKIFHAVLLVLMLAGAGLVFFGPWPKK
jgi:hypothetical protein